MRIMTDSEPTLESIASTRQVERKGSKMTVQEMKEKLIEGEIKSYQWLSTKEMWADGMTKEMEMADGSRKFLQSGKCEIRKEEVNKVFYENKEVKMLNIRNRKKKEEEVEEETGIKKIRKSSEPDWRI